ncbi:DUF6907 domain-containing protein [Streptomyces sp. YS-3]|uniref:DUF6907 domain-containing protein n=1 Tax=Streptomyces sp. YS-3 TaxID=3381352 RepID=UPI003862A533
MERDLAGWRASKAAESCPSWCAVDHAEDDPLVDAYVHTSQPCTVAMAPLVTGERVQLLFSTDQQEDFLTPDEPGAAKVDFTIEARGRNILHDYAVMADKPALDAVIEELERAAQTLRTWRERIPDHAPPQ